MNRNAVQALAASLPSELLAQRLATEGLRRRGDLARRYELDLVGFLNGASREELATLSVTAGLPAGSPGAMRQRLWGWGAALERRDVVAAIDPRVQPSPLVAGGRLRLARRRATAWSGVLPTARAARAAASATWPRPVPPPRDPPQPGTEPATVDDLLARADALVGVRLGNRGRDKGSYGQQVSELLGLPRSSASAPDWRGEVELKTLAVVRTSAGGWRLKDGPALSMRSVDARAKLRRVLWIIRIDEGEVADSPVLSWFYQELDPELASAFERARHLRPKGGRNTTARGWYLRRDFFVACGLLRSLNGERHE